MLLTTADELNMVLFANGTGGADLLLQIYNIASNTWGSLITVPASLVSGGDLSPFAVSPIVDNYLLFVAPDSGGAIGITLVQVNVATGSASVYPFSVATVSSAALGSVSGQSGTLFSFITSMWFSCYPTAYGLVYKASSTVTAHPIVFFDIGSGVVVDLLSRQYTQAGYGYNDGDISGNNSMLPFGRIWGLDSNLESSGYIGDPSNLFNDTDFTSSITFSFINANVYTGHNDPTTLQTLTVPYFALATSNGDITPNTTDTYQTNLFNAAYNNATNTGPGLYTNYANVTGTGYNVVLNPYNLSTETNGTQISVTTPTNFYPSTLIAIANAADNTAYIMNTSNFYKLVSVSSASTNVMIVS